MTCLLGDASLGDVAEAGAGGCAQCDRIVVVVVSEHDGLI